MSLLVSILPSREGVILCANSLRKQHLLNNSLIVASNKLDKRELSIIPSVNHMVNPGRKASTGELTGSATIGFVSP